VTGTDTDTGVYYPAANQVALATNGTLALIVDSSQNVGIGTASPAYTVDIKTASNNALRVGSVSNSLGTLIEWNNASGYGRLSALGGYPLLFNTNSTERMRLPAAGGVQAVTTISVGDATPSSSGAGITFPATQSASSDANTLDDYEEGTWTAGFAPDTSGTVTIDTSFRTATYTKVGRLVTVHAQLVVASVSSPNGILFITGLPFTPLSIGNGSQNRAAFPVSIAGVSSGNSGNFIGQVINNSTNLYVYYNNGTQPEASAANKCQTNSGVYFCATYVTST
jgi:hypothetical protein